MKRQRGRNRRPNNNQGNANRSMESNGPDVKVRGTAKQIYEKYETLARDAASSGNRVKAENCRQHAEHYLRIVNAIEAVKQAKEQADAAKAAENASHNSDKSEDKAADNSENGSEDKSSDKGDENRSRRRYPPQVKRSSKPDDSSDSSVDEKPVEGLETVEPEAAAEEAPKKTTRRRKAPSRNDSASEAAE